MCGIAGYVDFTYGQPLPRVLEAMARDLSKRGPDGNGTIIEGPCGLAHTRLSIIDVGGSAQPMRVPGADVSLVYNGELYNYTELRAEFRYQGIEFATNGDTEVVLRLVEQRWIEAIAKFDGMFGFAAWDRRRERLLLARDPYGEKPLYFATPCPGMIVFGSELKALLQHPEIDAALDLDALRQVLRFRAVYGTRSLHRGIQQLEPGSYLEFSQGGVRTGRFYDAVVEVNRAREQQRGLSEDQLIDQGGRLLRDSVRQRLIADVPVGAFLSGGLDSSLIVALMRQIWGSDAAIHTYSVGFRDDSTSELPHAKVVADEFGTRHTEVEVSEDHYLSRLVELTECRDAPISEASDVAVAQLSRVARREVKVALSGEGADEVFAGYPKHTFANSPRLLGWMLRTVSPSKVAWLASKCGVNHQRALAAARSLAHPNELDQLVQWFSYLDRPNLEALLPGLVWDQASWETTVEAQREALTRGGALNRLGRMQFVDCQTWLPCNLLERADRMTMAEGLECRPPFLDRELAAFGMALPPQMKVRGWTGKWIVRQWARKLLPQRIIARRKWGFRVPLARWFREGLRDMLWDYVTSNRGICGAYGNVRAVRSFLESHDSSRTDASSALWTLLSAEVWYQDVFLKTQQRGRPIPEPVAI